MSVDVGGDVAHDGNIYRCARDRRRWCPAEGASPGQGTDVLFLCTVSIEEDPTEDRLRDALGAVRCLWFSAEGMQGQKALKRAGNAIVDALAVTRKRRRDKELPGALVRVCGAIQGAVKAAPWAAPALLGALRGLGTLGRSVEVHDMDAPPARPLPPIGEDLEPDMRTPKPPPE
jgi:hypothetical protein